LLAIAEDCQERGIELLFLSEQLDTTTPAGRLIFTVFAALAAFEREQLVERTRAGMEAARVRGSQMGRPSVMPPERLAAAQRLASDGVPVAAIARSLGVSRATVYRHLRDGQAA
jgi:DNA invertase Pin-like site-specific DNA recombinase